MKTATSDLSSWQAAKVTHVNRAKWLVAVCLGKHSLQTNENCV